MSNKKYKKMIEFVKNNCYTVYNTTTKWYDSSFSLKNSRYKILRR